MKKVIIYVVIMIFIIASLIANILFVRRLINEDNGSEVMELRGGIINEDVETITKIQQAETRMGISL